MPNDTNPHHLDPYNKDHWKEIADLFVTCAAQNGLYVEEDYSELVECGEHLTITGRLTPYPELDIYCDLMHSVSLVEFDGDVQLDLVKPYLWEETLEAVLQEVIG